MKLYKSIYFRCILLLPAFCIVLLGCGGKKPYRIDGTIEGLGTQNVTAIYHDGTSLKSVTTNAVNSAFHIEGSSEEPVIIELYDNQRHRIGCIAAKNGEEIKVKFKTGDQYFMESSGDELTESLGEFLKKNSKGLNDAIERQIASAPTAELSMLLAGYYYDINENSVRADSILSLFDNSTIMSNAMLRSKAEIAARLAEVPDTVRTLELYSSNDTIVKFNPSKKTNTLYIFTDVHSMPDSIIDYADSLAHDIRVASIRMSIDSFGWHKDCRRFSKKVEHFWALGGVTNSQLRVFNIPRLPYFVVADTASRQIYRGATLPVLPK